MSKRRYAWEVVARTPGSGFIGAAEPRLVIIMPEADGQEPSPWCPVCREPECREWSNSWVIEPGPHPLLEGVPICHLSECEMEDPTPEDWARVGPRLAQEWVAFCEAITDTKAHYPTSIWPDEVWRKEDWPDGGDAAPEEIKRVCERAGAALARDTCDNIRAAQKKAMAYMIEEGEQP